MAGRIMCRGLAVALLTAGSFGIAEHGSAQSAPTATLWQVEARRNPGDWMCLARLPETADLEGLALGYEPNLVLLRVEAGPIWRWLNELPRSERLQLIANGMSRVVEVDPTISIQIGDGRRRSIAVTRRADSFEIVLAGNPLELRALAGSMLIRLHAPAQPAHPGHAVAIMGMREVLMNLHRCHVENSPDHALWIPVIQDGGLTSRRLRSGAIGDEVVSLMARLATATPSARVLTLTEARAQFLLPELAILAWRIGDVTGWAESASLLGFESINQRLRTRLRLQVEDERDLCARGRFSATSSASLSHDGRTIHQESIACPGSAMEPDRFAVIQVFMICRYAPRRPIDQPFTDDSIMLVHEGPDRAAVMAAARRAAGQVGRDCTQ